MLGNLLKFCILLIDKCTDREKQDLHMNFLKGKVVVNDGVFYADGVFFLSKETMKSDDTVIQESLGDLYDFISPN